MNRYERGEQLDEQVEQAFSDLESQLEAGYTEDFLKLLEFYSQFRSYSFGNMLLIMLQHPTAEVCAGFRQWEKLGFQVRKGEQAIWLKAPRIKKVTNEETGEITEQLVGWLAVPVFAQDQLVESDALPTRTHPLEGDYHTLYYLSRAAIGAEGILIVEDTLPAGVHGISAGGKIVIKEDLSDSEKCLVTWHEWAHEILHRGEDRDELSREQKELEAEALSFVVARLMGLDNPFSRDYITNWEGTVESLHASMSRIHQAAKHIYSLLETMEYPQDLSDVA